MRASSSLRSAAAVSVAFVTALVLVSACSSNQAAATPPATPSTGLTVALGTDNPAQGDCTTNTSEAATSVGSVVLSVTPSSFTVEIQLQAASPNASYGVFLQQVPGSCPQWTSNGGTLTTDSAGRGHATATVARVPGATTFYVQLVPGAAGQGQYTSDRISSAP